MLIGNLLCIPIVGHLFNYEKTCCRFTYLTKVPDWSNKKLNGHSEWGGIGGVLGREKVSRRRNLRSADREKAGKVGHT